MHLTNSDWLIIVLFFIITLIIGLSVVKKSGQNSEEFFLSGRKMPWWLLGISMVATTFSADTPNLVTDIVRVNGVAGNWAWWAFLLTGMLTVFVYARLWRRSEITTDLEFYEMRYSGAEARILRAFRAFYLGVVFNVLIMGTVMLAGIKIAGILLGLSAIETVLIVSVITVIYSSFGGLRGVLYTDFFQFIIAMIGMVWACIYIVNMPEIGGLTKLLSHEVVKSKMDFIPSFDNKDMLISLFIIPIAVQWWSTWYPGAEPGGGGYVAQRMLSAKDETNAVTATLLFNIAHYALRPWPWILIALASLVVFPNVSDIAAKFPGLNPQFIKDDLAFPAMLSFLPSGLLGMVIAALIAALMSTLSTHLNWGSSYIVNDLYHRFYRPNAEQKTLVRVGQLSTVVLMFLGAGAALMMENAKQSFDIILQIGAGTGLLFILRWFWWRVNAVSEITAMVVSFLVALVLQLDFASDLVFYEKLLISVVVTNVCWILVALYSKPTQESVLISFVAKIRPMGQGWAPIIEKAMQTGALTSQQMGTGKLAHQILAMIVGCFMIYGLLFGLGYLLYGQMMAALICLGVFFISAFLIWKLWNTIKN
ncbi:MAG: Na+:solute symporter [Saprospiraceae bacterium]|nr:Na+:solute symporter [Saprospiraceae bacterium]MBK8852404.1 Na+:solute symporter [Saprospiraceae bacterium]